MPPPDPIIDLYGMSFLCTNFETYCVYRLCISAGLYTEKLNEGSETCQLKLAYCCNETNSLEIFLHNTSKALDWFVSARIFLDKQITGRNIQLIKTPLLITQISINYNLQHFEHKHNVTILLKLLYKARSCKLKLLYKATNYVKFDIYHA